MRVALLTHQFFPAYFTGVERLALNLARQLRLMGHVATVVTAAEYSSGDEQPYAVGGVRVRPVAAGRPDLARPWTQAPDVTERLGRALIEEEVELVHVMHPMRLPQVLDAAAGIGLPVVAHVADFNYLCARVNLLRVDGSLCPTADHGRACVSACGIDSGPERVAWGRSFLQRVDHVITPCRHTIDVFASQGFETARWRHVPWGVDYGLHARRLAPPRGDRLTIGFLGTLVAHKGAHVLVEAVRRLPERPVEVRLYGASFHEGAYEEELRKLAGGDERIRFEGVYQHVDFLDVLAPLDAVAIPSLWYENLPTTGLNAVASGVPLLVSDVGGLEELILDYNCGLTFPAGDADALAAILDRLCGDRGELERLRGGMLYPPSIEEEAWRVETVYSEALARDPAVAA
jgi:glycosyltransferase involved in cell wall biosynthesis